MRRPHHRLQLGIHAASIPPSESWTMKHTITTTTLFCLVVAWSIHSAHAAIITYSAQNIGGDAWEYAYEVANESFGVGIDSFTIFFDEDSFADLAIVASPPDWDSIVIQPDLILPDAGFFDSLALADPIALGSTLGGFAASFRFLGTGAPGSQLFTINDADFNPIFSGSTILRIDGEPPPPPVGVPEPPTLGLLAIAFLGLAVAHWRRGRPRVEKLGSLKCPHLCGAGST